MISSLLRSVMGNSKVFVDREIATMDAHCHATFQFFVTSHLLGIALLAASKRYSVLNIE